MKQNEADKTKKGGQIELIKHYNVEEAAADYDRQLFEKQAISIDDFLMSCSPEIIEEVRPLIELQVYLKRFSKKKNRNIFASLLSAPEVSDAEVDTKQFMFNPKETSYDMEARSLMDEKTKRDIIKDEGMLNSSTDIRTELIITGKNRIKGILKSFLMKIIHKINR